MNFQRIRERKKKIKIFCDKKQYIGKIIQTSQIFQCTGLFIFLSNSSSSSSFVLREFSNFIFKFCFLKENERRKKKKKAWFEIQSFFLCLSQFQKLFPTQWIDEESFRNYSNPLNYRWMHFSLSPIYFLFNKNTFYETLLKSHKVFLFSFSSRTRKNPR